MGLIVKNIGGIRKGMEDMGIQGNPGKYSMVIAENEEGSPWEPFHTEQGLKKEDSAISVSTPNIYIQTWPYGTDDEGILRGIIYNLVPGRRGTLCVTLPPQFAKTLAQNGWKKQDIKEFISEYGRAPAYRTAEFWPGSPAFTDTRGLMGNKVNVREMDDMPLMLDPDAIAVIVAGGPGPFIGLHIGGNKRVVKKIELPSGWKSLVEKYKNIVPAYARY